MNINTRILILLATSLLLISCEQDKLESYGDLDLALEHRLKIVSPTGDPDYFILPESDDFDNINQDPLNPLTKEKVKLGKLLFYETGIARNAMLAEGMESFSCASCHIPSAGFRPGRVQGIADGGMGFGINGEDRRRHPSYEEDELDVQAIRPLSVLNVSFTKTAFWSGQFGATGANLGLEEIWNKKETTKANNLGYEGIETQTIESIKLHRMAIDEVVLDEFGYRSLFDEAFSGDIEEDRYSDLNAALAISAYLRTLYAQEAPFQKWLKREREAMTDAEKRGALLFFDKAGCFKCHNNPALGSASFYAIGVKDLYEQPAFQATAADSKNLGRGGFTGAEVDNYKFKVPQLYNMEDTPFYFHGSSMRSLEDVIDYFDVAQAENENVPATQISNDFKPLGLSADEKRDLLYFLKKGLKDDDLDRYMPPAILSGNCFPNNDYQSRVDLGCE